MDRGDDDGKGKRGLFKLGDIHWDRYIKRYVWDDDTTPYLVPVQSLNRRQAGYELTAYAIFLGFLFGIVAVITLSAQAPGGRSAGMSLYSFTAVCAAVLLGTTRNYYAALYCSSAAPASLIWIYVFAHHPNLKTLDHAVLVIFALLWMRYGLRIIAIARGYDGMPEGVSRTAARRGWGRRRR